MKRWLLLSSIIIIITISQFYSILSYTKNDTFDDLLTKYAIFHNNHTVYDPDTPVIIYTSVIRGGMNNRIVSTIVALTIALVKWKLFYCILLIDLYCIDSTKVGNIYQII